jgi:sugar phosphate isomerase/epimerase
VKTDDSKVQKSEVILKNGTQFHTIPWGITCFFEYQKDFAMVAEMAPQFPLSYLEIRGEKPFFSPDDLSSADVDFFKKIIKKSGLRLTLHATFYDINLATLNSYLRPAILNCYKKYLDVGAQLGAEIMVVHGGLVHKDAAPLNGFIDRARKNLVENLQVLGDYAAGKNIVIGLENSPPNSNHLMIDNWKIHQLTLQAVNHPQVKAVLDVAHAFLHGLDVDEYYRQMKDELVEIHVHNNDGREDLHQAMDEGTIPYSEFFLKNTVEIPVIMEIHNITGAMQSLEWIKKINEK